MIIDGWRGPGWQIIDADAGYGRQIPDQIKFAIRGHDCTAGRADAAMDVVAGKIAEVLRSVVGKA